MTTTRSETADIGYAKQKQYGASNARRHKVVKNERDRWETFCTQKPATREYKGWVNTNTITCNKCRVALGLKEEKA